MKVRRAPGEFNSLLVTNYTPSWTHSKPYCAVHAMRSSKLERNVVTSTCERLCTHWPHDIDILGETCGKPPAFSLPPFPTRPLGWALGMELGRGPPCGTAGPAAPHYASCDFHGWLVSAARRPKTGGPPCASGTAGEPSSTPKLAEEIGVCKKGASCDSKTCARRFGLQSGGELHVVLLQRREQKKAPE